MNVQPSREAGVLVLRLDGPEALDCECAQEVKTTVLEAMDGVSDVVVDLSSVDFVDSAGVAVLVSLVKAARLSGLEIVFAGARRGVLSVLEIIRLDQILTLRPDIPEAIGALADRTASTAP